jgi:exopolyphosphatase / guanosine-5'-triphosphate,3'-diphosphate pyrophosphatase
MTMVGAPVAAVDCGTNSTRLLVVDADGHTIAREMHITRLGQGVDATRHLDSGAVRRTLTVLSDYRRTMDSLGVDRVRLVATSAVRDADNGADFLDAAGRTVGTRAELLSGLEEGRTAFAGATAGLAPPVGTNVVVDIGGGSTELIVGRTAVVGAVSLDIGCVRLTERHLHHDPPTSEEIDATAADIGAGLDRADREVAQLQALPPGSRLVGLAGTVSTLAMLSLDVTDYDRDRIHHVVMPAETVEHWCEVLVAEPTSARARRPGMVEGREDVIVGGALVLREVMHRYRFDDCLVSESDILDGLAASLLGV